MTAGEVLLFGLFGVNDPFNVKKDDIFASHLLNAHRHLLEMIDRRITDTVIK
jgi:hypothetical protein